MMKKNKDQIIYGIHAVLEALDAGREMEKVLLRSGRLSNDALSEIRRRVLEAGIPFQHVPQERLNTITGKNHQGVIAYVSEISYSEIEFILEQVFQAGKNPLILILDQVSDVRNFGAIARTSECAGVDAIVIPFKGSARISGEAVKTSAGALNRIPVCRHPDLNKLIIYLKNSGLEIFAASEKAEKSVYEADLTVPAAILMGAEDQGISRQLLDQADSVLTIPQFGSIGSLNVSVAAGIIIYEAVRQRISKIRAMGFDG